MIRNFLFFIFHIHVFMKFWYTNRRFKKYGYRRFKVTLQEEIPKKQGGGFHVMKPVVITAENWETAFFMLKIDHQALFEKCDHLTYKEII